MQGALVGHTDRAPARGKRHRGRECAVQLLFELDYNPRAIEEALADFWAERRVPAQTKAFVEQRVRGVLTERETIDGLLERSAEHWKLKRMAGVDRNIMRLAVYEMLRCPDVPPAVAINEAVELAKHLGDTGSGRFVNGVLDRIRRDLASTGAIGQPGGE